MLLSGNVCGDVLDADVRRTGSAFICGFADTFVLMWVMLAFLIQSYCVYIVWSASEAVRDPTPTALRYVSKLLHVPDAYPGILHDPGMIMSIMAKPGAELQHPELQVQQHVLQDNMDITLGASLPPTSKVPGPVAILSQEIASLATLQSSFGTFGGASAPARTPAPNFGPNFDFGSFRAFGGGGGSAV
jgi:hypothetical protein